MKVGVFGATGQVGSVMRAILIERDFPVDEIRFFASSRSAGQKIEFKGDQVEVEDADLADFSGIEVALFSCGANASKVLAPRVAKSGAVVVDNSSAWRMDDDVPLIVPEVNGVEIKNIKKGIIANPNCTTMVAMPVLAPLHKEWGLNRIVATTFQAVSGAGGAGVKELADQVFDVGQDVSKLAFDGSAVDLGLSKVFPANVAFNVIPMAGSLVNDGSGDTNEETKLRDESRKILGIADLDVTATCTRVGVMTGHSLSITAWFRNETSTKKALELLELAPSVELVDIPTPLLAAGRDPSFVGRVRSHYSDPTQLSLFVSGDNLRKGAALNAVQIAELLL